MNDTINARGLVLLGCGKMGSAMLAGWLDRGLVPDAVWVTDPAPSDWLRGLSGIHLNAGRLAHEDSAELGFLEIGLQPGLRAVHERGDPAACGDELADIQAFDLADRAIRRCVDFGLFEIAHGSGAGEPGRESR